MMVVKWHSLVEVVVLALVLVALVFLGQNPVHTQASELAPLSSALHVLPPLGENTGDLNAFDQTLTDFLTVTVCEVESGGGCTIVREFTSQKNEGGGLNYIKLQNHHYHVNWNVSKDDAGKEFEIHFAVAGLEVGYITFMPSTGRTVPIKFRIDNHPRIRARVLHEQGYSAAQVAQALIDEFNLSAEATARILADEAYSLGDIYGVLTDVFAIGDVFEIERILEGLGFKPEEYLEFTARASVERFAPVLKFDRAMWYLPMSAERWFDRMLCGGDGPPFANGSYNYGACASWDISSYDSPDMPYERWVWGNPPPVGGRGGFMYVPPVQALVGVQDFEDPRGPDYWWGTFGPQGSPNVPTYFKVMKSEATGALRIMYWWFYSHQSPCEWSANWDAFSDSNGEHIGDWERIMITTSPDRSTIEAVTYFQHGGSYTRWSSVSGGFQTESGGHTVQAERAVVYVGMLSHGSYYDSPDITFFPYFSDACQYFRDQREPASENDWWVTDANLVSLRSGEESWMEAESAPLPRGASERWAWGPAVNQCSINLGVCPVPFPPWVIPCPLPPPAGWCVKHDWETACGNHPTLRPGVGADGQENWCLDSCGSDGCDADQWSLIAREERDNWNAWCQGSSSLSSPGIATTDARLDRQVTSAACDPTSSACKETSTDLENTFEANTFEALYEMAARDLGMSVKELKAAIADGRIQTICEYAEAQGQDVADVWTETESARQLALQKALEEGELTQAQVEWIREHLAELDPVEWCLERGPAVNRHHTVYLPLVQRNW